jgi:flagellar hook-associated protein 3 FlgL
MRITDHMTYRQAARDVQRQRTAAYELQAQAASGKKFQSISEDPVGAERVRLLRSSKEAITHYQENITRSKTQLDSADGALDEATSIVVRAKEISMAMANETTSPEQRQIAADEIASLFSSLVTVANTRAAGEYIFGGYQTDAPPFQSDGTYDGDSGMKEVEVGPSQRLTVNVSGEDAFTASGGLDVFGELQALQTALNADDTAGIQNAVGTLDDALTQITSARTDAGLKLNQLDVAGNVCTRISDSLTTEESGVIDTDTVQVFLDLNETTSALENAIAVSRKMMDVSLMSTL